MCTCSDICFTAGRVSCYQSNPELVHWQAVKRILRYLRGTTDLMLTYSGSDLRMRGYSDVDWASDKDERKSTSGYAFVLGDGAITCCSKKQTYIALSMMESEYVACLAAVQEAVWLRSFLQRLSVSSIQTTLYLYIVTVQPFPWAFTKDPKFHGKAKHIDIRYHYTRDMVAQGEVVLKHISTYNMLVDPLTKPIARDVYLVHIRNLGLRRN
ncbi:secreted RxLR effector protein 161-like [Telopea speciosissima]|uniref:secreted RxLR effector protein 161-like n=1 Tax=Telopea speciosissima TaxID=54955 RepID=UPI001CC4FCC4|nr:secreted RxLR effector protein 161-like [Telopea speciosissima]